MPDIRRSKILITGATGYIGRRLKERLLQRTDLSLRLLVRNRDKVRPDVLEKVEVIEGDTFNPIALEKAVRNIDVAYYLIHSMGSGVDFEELDRKSADNFRTACIRAGVKRIIYLGGLGTKETASRHLRSRRETGEILSNRPDAIQTIWFRAGVIIGSGSASFEIIHNLVHKLPVMVTPRWVRTKTQPIGVEDVINYLEQAATVIVDQPNLTIDIGTAPMSFQEMMHAAAKVMGLKRFLFPVPFLSPRLSSYWLIFFTPIPYTMAAALVEGLKSETLVLNNNAERYFPDILPGSYEQAVAKAVLEIERDQVLSRWCDSSAGTFCDVKDQGDTGIAVLRDIRKVSLGGLDPQRVFQSACTIGGNTGWYTYDILWQIRGYIDKMAGGYGLNRGRRAHRRLRVGDALDFWKVVDLKENKRLLLLAQMKVPGKAWLEFNIQDDVLIQTAHFFPRGILGRLYWYSVAPLHNLVFSNLAEKIVEHAHKPRLEDAQEHSAR